MDADSKYAEYLVRRTPEEEAELTERINRVLGVLRPYYKAHGFPANRGEILAQASELCFRFYPPVKKEA